MPEAIPLQYVGAASELFTETTLHYPAVENLHNKYAVTVKQILAVRDAQADQLNHFLVELGYE